jgi:hypothetical protein
MHARTDTPMHARAHTHADTYPFSLYLLLFIHTLKHPTPLTAPELADDTTYSGSQRTYKTAACGHT